MSKNPPPMALLQRRETVAEMSAYGMSNRAIAQALNVSHTTINNDVRRITDETWRRITENRKSYITRELHKLERDRQLLRLRQEVGDIQAHEMSLKYHAAIVDLLGLRCIGRDGQSQVGDERWKIVFRSHESCDIKLDFDDRGIPDEPKRVENEALPPADTPQTFTLPARDLEEVEHVER